MKCPVCGGSDGNHHDVQAPKSLRFECPFTGLKFSFHTQEQVDMLQKHFEVLAARYHSDAEIEQAIIAHGRNWIGMGSATNKFAALILARLAAKEKP